MQKTASFLKLDLYFNFLRRLVIHEKAIGQKGVLSQAHLSFQNKHCSGQKGTVRTLQRAQCAQCSAKKSTSKGTVRTLHIKASALLYPVI